MARDMFDVGLLIPDSNTVTARDLSHGLVDVARLHVETMHLAEPVTPQGEREMLQTHALAAAERLAFTAPQLSVFGCSSALSLIGREAAAEFLGDLTSLIGGDVIDVNSCLIEALGAVGAQRITLISPYESALHNAVGAQLEGEGFHVAAGQGMGIAKNAEVGRVSPRAVAAFSLANLGDDSDAVVIACGNLRGYEAASAVTTSSGLPVVTPNGAVIDALVRLLGTTAPQLGHNHRGGG
jgi:maleate isomerase